MSMHDDIKNVLVSEEELKAKVRELGAQISRDYEGKNLVLVSILKGSVVFMGELMKKVNVPCEIDFMKVSSYGNETTSSGNVNIILDISRKDLDSCDILIVEDIIDSGRTLSYLSKYLLNKGARSVRTCTMLDKPSRRVVDFSADYVGAEIEDLFVVGYGLDYAERYRDLPYIGVLKSEVYA